MSVWLKDILALVFTGALVIGAMIALTGFLGTHP